MRSPIATPMKIFIVMPVDIPIEILVVIPIGEGEAHAETLCPYCHPYRDPYCHPYRYPYRGSLQPSLQEEEKKLTQTRFAPFDGRPLPL